MKKTISLLLTLTLCLTFLFSCNFQPEKPDDDGAKINIGVMAGPTGMGMAKLMSDNKDDTSKYGFEIYSDPQVAMPDLINKQLDMLCLPTNAAANLFNKNNGLISVIAVNTLGSLYLLTDANTTIESVADLEGKTIYTSVASSTTVPILQTILTKNGVNATIEVEENHDSLVARVVKNEVSIAVLPEPKVSATLKQNSAYKIALDISEEWDKVSENSLTMGCIVVRNEFLQNHEGAVARFLEEYEASINYISDLTNLDTSAQLIVEGGVLPALPIAKSALSNLSSSIVFLAGEDMKASLIEFYSVLLDTMPNAIGNALPNNAFYYVK